MDISQPNMRGFHLIEILSTVAILSILVALSLPIYSQYTIGVKRIEAENTLSKLAIAMEKFHVEHNTYENATLEALHFPATIVRNNYRLTIQTAANNHYILIAEPLGKQAEKDQHCAGLILYSNDKKGVTGSGNVEECW
jgi:type IV pilus assembly protein PilE